MRTRPIAVVNRLVSAAGPRACRDGDEPILTSAGASIKTAVLAVCEADLAQILQRGQPLWAQKGRRRPGLPSRKGAQDE